MIIAKRPRRYDGTCSALLLRCASSNVLVSVAVLLVARAFPRHVKHRQLRLAQKTLQFCIQPCSRQFVARHSWAEAPIKIARMTLTIKLDGNWSSFQLANSAPPLSVTDSAIAPSARMGCVMQAEMCRRSFVYMSTCFIISYLALQSPFKTSTCGSAKGACASKHEVAQTICW